MSPSCFLREIIKNTQRKTVIILYGQTGFLEEMDNGLETGLNLIFDSVKMAKFMSYFNNIYNNNIFYVRISLSITCFLMLYFLSL